MAYRTEETGRRGLSVFRRIGPSEDEVIEFNPLTLTFVGSCRDLEIPFRENHFSRSAIQARAVVIAAAAVFGLYGILDVILAPGQRVGMLVIRYGLAMPFFILAVILSFTRWYRFLAQGLSAGLVIIGSAAMAAMIAIGPPPVSHFYFAGLMLALAFNFTLARLRFLWATLAGLVVVALFWLALTVSPVPPLTGLAGHLFLITALLVGMTACYFIEYGFRRSFFLNHLLSLERDKVSLINTRLEETVRTRTADLGQANQYLTALHDVSLGLMKRLDLDDLLETMVIRAGELTGTDHGFVLLWDPEAQKLIMRVGTGTLEDAVGIRLDSGQGFAGRVFARGMPLSVDDYSSWPDRMDTPLFEGIRAMVGVPLTSGDEVVGVIGLVRVEEGRLYGAEEVLALERFAELASIALDNANLHQKMVDELAERQRTEAEKASLLNQLNQAQKMEAVGTLAGGIAHDFNNILSAIIGYTELAVQDSEEGRLPGDDLRQILRAGRRARDLVAQILSFSRQTDLRKEPADLVELISETIHLIRATLPSTIDIVRDIRLDSAVVMVNPTQISQVMMNLATNAFQAMGDTGGRLTIRLADLGLDDPDLTVSGGSGSPNFVVLSVSDTGCGMAEEDLDRIFDPFYTTKGVGLGTGLGLSVVHGIISGHGGTITVASTPDRGSTFEVYLPLHQTPARRNRETDRTDDGGDGERILFVDDEPVLAALGRRMLSRRGYRVTDMTSSREALELFRSDPQSFDLVISDQTMPGLTGLQLAERMHEIRPDLPMILCTGYSSMMSELRSAGSGVSRVVMKPLSGDEMGRAVREVLAAAG